MNIYHRFNPFPRLFAVTSRKSTITVMVDAADAQAAIDAVAPLEYWKHEDCSAAELIRKTVATEAPAVGCSL